MMRTIPVVLGGRTFDVVSLTLRADAMWRKSVKHMIDPIAELAVASGAGSPTPDKLTRLAFASSLFVDPGAVLDALLSYSPELAAEAEWIGEHAYADEALQALLSLFFGMTSAKSVNGAAQTPPPTT
jgi:hypothetical protein